MNIADKMERESRLRGNLAKWMMAHGTVKSDRERSNEYVRVRIAGVRWRGQDYCITWVDGEACRIEKE
jgi:hypothetical protein